MTLLFLIISLKTPLDNISDLVKNNNQHVLYYNTIRASQ